MGAQFHLVCHQNCPKILLKQTLCIEYRNQWGLGKGSLSKIREHRAAARKKGKVYRGGHGDFSRRFKSGKLIENDAKNERTGV
jgi:hypothetical protein